MTYNPGFYSLPPSDIGYIRPGKGMTSQIGLAAEGCHSWKLVIEPFYEAGFGHHVAMSTIASKYS